MECAPCRKVFLCIRACLKIHSCHLHAPFRGRFAPNSLNVAHYAALIRDKSPTKCDAHLTESNFQTRSRNTFPITQKKPPRKAAQKKRQFHLFL
ncbi:DUF6783 domain-containing protein [Hungatella effluvii]|uniref:DUF6783 domain-containing protein n=1 Tax=Hungatella effluvii TaxID=1096246 RepID=UPI003D80E1C3